MDRSTPAAWDSVWGSISCRRARSCGAVVDAERITRSYQAFSPMTVQAMVVRGPEWDGSSDAKSR